MYQTQNDFQRRNFPLAYLLTIRAYGTWVHGDELGSVDENHNAFGQPRLASNPRREAALRETLAESVTLFRSKAIRELISNEIERTGLDRQWRIWVYSVQPTHVHLVAATGQSPQVSSGALKARISLALHRAGHFENKRRIWAQGSSGRYLWTEEALRAAIDYVAKAQSMPGGRYEEAMLRGGKDIRNPIERVMAFKRERKKR